ncbi:hypothetical protein C1634_011660 [Chryseobacterium viscerum]|uniref:Uncharacterized protein n=1 Tax=Chryseobacterium viscerum TaxID=1037377 RepID=A0A316WKG6_9FLAO|nr:hypothetical protein C1634_011660 [Chryseobacterium viscerum]
MKYSIVVNHPIRFVKFSSFKRGDFYHINCNFREKSKFFKSRYISIKIAGKVRLLSEKNISKS